MSTDTLAKMGIANPTEIVRYTLRQKSGREDVLKVFYEREKGSFLPVSRTYRFGRGMKTSVADSGEPRFDDSYEISPVLLEAVTELDALVGKPAGASAKDELMAEIDAMKAMLEGGKPVDASALSKRLTKLKERAGRV